MKHPTKTYFGNRGKWARSLPPAVFEKAQSETLAEAPERCDRCGNPWKIVPDGYQCRICPRHWLVAEKLRELVGRPLDHAAAWPVTRINHGGPKPRA